MSVIVWDGTTLAADSHANNGDLAFPYPKLWALPDNRLAGAVGPLQAVTQMQQWTLDGLPPTKFPLNTGSPAQLLLVSKEKGVVRYRDSSIPYLHGSNKLAIGEGAPFAYGALFMGATAEQAVLAAIDGSPHCNGQVISLKL